MKATCRKSISPPSSGLMSKPMFAFWLFHAGFLFCLLINPEDRNDVPPKRWLTFNRLHYVISHRTELFITKTERTSNPPNHGSIFLLSLYGICSLKCNFLRRWSLCRNKGILQLFCWIIGETAVFFCEIPVWINGRFKLGEFKKRTPRCVWDINP
jgi:hypothetical protein